MHEINSLHRIAGVLCLCLLSLMSRTAFAQGPTAAQELRALNAELLSIGGDERATGTVLADSSAAGLLARRARLLRELVESAPQQALELAFAGEVLAELAQRYPDSVELLERRGRWRGALDVLVEDDFDARVHREVYRLERDGEVMSVHFAGAAPPALVSGRRVRVQGVRIADAVAVSETELLDAQPDGVPGAAAADGVVQSCSSSGPQSLLSVLVDLPDYDLPSEVTPDTVRGALLGNAHTSADNTPDWSLDDFWRQGSDGRTFLDPALTRVVGPVRLSKNFDRDANGGLSCDNHGLRDAVIRAVDGQVDFRQYSLIQIVMPAIPGCGWTGTANVGCRAMSSPGDGAFNAAVSWQKATAMRTRTKAVQLSAHEHGHNLGLHHASTRDFGTEPLGDVGAAGALAEYGDKHSAMGAWSFGFYASSQAANTLGWLAAGSNYRVVETPGTYTIRNYEARPAGVKALKVRRGSGVDAWLWVESRQDTGLYSSQLAPALFTGALIHYQDASTGNASHLLDFTPATASFRDGALQAGETWRDPYSNLSLRVDKVGVGTMTLTVDYGALSCTRKRPTVSVAPAAFSVKRGTATSVSVVVRNNSSAGCDAERFDLGADTPAGWTHGYSAALPALDPGASAVAILDLGVPPTAVPGAYSITARATSVASSLSDPDLTTANVVAP